MDEQGLQNLLALGFTYEDLYKRGLLVLKPAEQKQPEQKQPEQKQPEQQPEQKQPEQKQPKQKQPEQKQPKQEQDATAVLTAVLQSFKDDLISAIQKTNLRDATRDENKKMSIDDAIAGLMKGDSING